MPAVKALKWWFEDHGRLTRYRGAKPVLRRVTDITHVGVFRWHGGDATVRIHMKDGSFFDGEFDTEAAAVLWITNRLPKGTTWKYI